MKKLILICLFLVPGLLFSQFGDRELYGYTRVGISFGMRDFMYTSNIEGLSMDYPVSIPLKLGSGITPEVGIGLMIVKHFFIEANVGITVVNKNGYQPENTEFYIESYRFNRTNIGFNGIYLIDVEDNFNIELNVGLSAVLPEDLTVITSRNIETVRYSTTIGLQTGFALNYLIKDFSFGGGLNYRVENFKTKYGQKYPSEFYHLNPNMYTIKVSSFIITLSAKYLF